MHANRKGPGFQKLNTYLLTETTFVNVIKTTIEEIQEEYEQDDLVDAALLWDLIKLQIREKSLSYAAIKTKKVKQC